MGNSPRNNTPTSIPTFPTLNAADIASIAAAVAPMIAQALTPALSTPTPVIEATTVKAPKTGKAGKAPKVEMVTYRKDHSGVVKTGTRRQFEARKVAAARLGAGHTLTEISTERVRPARTAPANATPAPVVAATSTPKADKKAARSALSQALTANLGRAYTRAEWDAAKAQAGLV